MTTIDWVEEAKKSWKLGYEQGIVEERQRVVEMIEKMIKVTDELGFSDEGYDQALNDLQSKLEEVPKGYVINPVDDGVAKYIKKDVEKIEVSQCPSCLCMTKTVSGDVCGKCRHKKTIKDGDRIGKYIACVGSTSGEYIPPSYISEIIKSGNTTMYRHTKCEPIKRKRK